MDRHQYLAITGENVAVIARASGSAPSLPVPSCPAWRLRDLGFHIACVLNLWTDVVRRASTERHPLGHGMQPPPDNHLEEFVRSAGEAFLDELAKASDDTAAWNWRGDATSRRIPRRLAQETAIHRWDATNALGKPGEIPPALAADGITEFFEVMMPYTGRPPKRLAGTFALVASDTGRRWTVTLKADTLPTIAGAHASEPAQTTVSGPATALLLLLWRRTTPENLDISGDTDLIRQFLAYPTLD